MPRCESCPGTATMKEFFDQELSEHEGDEKFNYCQWETMNRAILTTFAAPCEGYKETLTNVIDDLTRHPYIAKLKIISFQYRTILVLVLNGCYLQEAIVNLPVTALMG